MTRPGVHTTISAMRLRAVFCLGLLSLPLAAAAPAHAPMVKKAAVRAETEAPKGPDAELALLISEGLNWLDTGRDDLALKSFLEVLKREPRNPDALLHLGVLHLRRGHLDPAIEYLRKADAHRGGFLRPQTALDVNLYLAAAWRQYRRPDLEEAALHTLLTRVTGYADGGIRGRGPSRADHPAGGAPGEVHASGQPAPELDEEGVPVLTEERVAGGKALFALALLTRGQGRPMESRLYFERAIAFAHFPRLCHLYLAHWYASRSQDDVDAEVVAWTKANPSFKKKGEDRAFYLRRHARLMEESDASGREEADLLVSPPILELRDAVRRGLKNLDAAPASDEKKPKGSPHDDGRKPAAAKQP